MSSLKILQRLVVGLIVLLLTICAAGGYMFHAIKKPLLSDAAARELRNDPLMITLVFTMAALGKTLAAMHTDTIPGCKEVPLNINGVKGVVRTCLNQESEVTVFAPCYRVEALAPNADSIFINRALAATKFLSKGEARAQEQEVQQLVGQATLVIPVQECTFNARVIAVPDVAPIPAQAIQTANTTWASLKW